MKPDFIRNSKKAEKKPTRIENMEGFFKQKGIGPTLYRTIFLFILIALLFEISLLMYDSYKIEKDYLKLQSLKGNVKALNETEISLLTNQYDDKKIGRIIPKNDYVISGKINFYSINKKRAFYFDEFECNECPKNIKAILLANENNKDGIGLSVEESKTFAFQIENKIDLNEYNILSLINPDDLSVIGVVYLN